MFFGEGGYMLGYIGRVKLGDSEGQGSLASMGLQRVGHTHTFLKSIEFVTILLQFYVLVFLQQVI